MSENENIGGAMITSPGGIELMRWTTIRSALKIEIITGMKRSNRGRPTLVLANEIMGTHLKSKRAAYDALNAKIVLAGGMDKPLPR
jgi:hypothetical protein